MYNQSKVNEESRNKTLSLYFKRLKELTRDKFHYDGQQASCNTTYSGSGINHMWILKNFKDLLQNLKSRSFPEISSLQNYDFSTLNTTLPHNKLKSRLKGPIHRYLADSRNYVVLGYKFIYFLKRSRVKCKKTPLSKQAFEGPDNKVKVEK